MSEDELREVPATALGRIRPLSVRITDGLRAQLGVIAQRNDRSVTEEMRLACVVQGPSPQSTGRGPTQRPVCQSWHLMRNRKTGRVLQERS